MFYGFSLFFSIAFLAFKAFSVLFRSLLKRFCSQKMITDSLSLRGIGPLRWWKAPIMSTLTGYWDFIHHTRHIL